MSQRDAQTLREALHQFDEENDAAAEPLLRQLAARYPHDYRVNEALGSVYVDTGEPERALPFLASACKLQPKQAPAHANLGVAYLKLHRGAEATHELQMAAKLDPANAQTQEGLGQSLMLISRPAEAAVAFAAATALQPKNADDRYDWALALSESHAPFEAEAVLKDMPPADMTDETHGLAGDVEERLGHYREAVLHYQSAAQMNPSDANLYSLTLELLRHWTWAEALQVANFGGQKFPSEARFRLAAGIALFGDNKYPEAASAFSQLLAGDPTNEAYADLLGRSCSAVAEGVDSNCSGLGEFALAHPGNAPISVYAAASILHKPATEEDLARADKMLQQAIASDPKLAGAYYQLGVLAQQRRQWKDSAAALEKAVQLRPDDAEAHYRLSRAYEHLNRHDDAQREVALHAKYSQQEKEQLNARLGEVVLFVLKPS